VKKYTLAIARLMMRVQAKLSNQNLFAVEERW